MATLVRHRWMTVAGVETFYREAGRRRCAGLVAAARISLLIL